MWKKLTTTRSMCLSAVIAALYAALTLLLPAVLSSMEHKKLATLFKVGISLCFVAFGLYSLRGDTAARSYPYFAFWEW